MKNTDAIALLVCAAVFILGVLCMEWLTYTECRAHGFSVFYCATAK